MDAGIEPQRDDQRPARLIQLAVGGLEASELQVQKRLVGPFRNRRFAGFDRRGALSAACKRGDEHHACLEIRRCNRLRPFDQCDRVQSSPAGQTAARQCEVRARTLRVRGRGVLEHAVAARAVTLRGQDVGLEKRCVELVRCGGDSLARDRQRIAQAVLGLKKASFEEKRGDVPR